MAQSPHLLSLKVLRVTRPSLGKAEGEYYEKTSLGGIELNSEEAGLMLPSSFGTVYLGQRFAALLSLSNEVEESASNPVLKAEMHTSGQSRALHARCAAY